MALHEELAILVVDDDPIALKIIDRILTKEGFKIRLAQNGSSALAQIKNGWPDIVLTDLVLDEISGLDILAEVKRRMPETEVVILTGHASVNSTIEAIKAGAFHYLEKPLKPDLLRHTIRQAAEKYSLAARVRNLEIEEEDGSLAIIGKAPALAEVKRLIRYIKESDSNVLITGETGTGKELAARAIHKSSTRRNRKFLAVNCASFTEQLLPNELFGHEREAYTGAASYKAGLLESADGGTVFFDEVGDMPLTMQAKLLRVIQERQFFRVGGTKPISIDTRIIAATNRDLKKLCDAGCFRRDLFFRLNVIGINMPALCEHRDDIPMLISHFLKKVSARAGSRIEKVSREAMQLLKNYGYPGNVRELENIVEHASSMARGRTIEVEDLPPDLTDFHSSTFHQKENELESLEEAEKRYIRWVLEKVGNKKSHAAKILGIDRSSLYRKMKRYELTE
ncbi:MAG: sigma-54 dependent transcriptional regulator [Planctomycetes bacterium]|nr:sigma-54 dependent transcriptional regulator [Planctomycetota bacterium]